MNPVSSTSLTQGLPAESLAAPARARARRFHARTSLLAQREPMLWLTGGALAIALLMISGLLVLIFYEGARSLWPLALTQITTHDGHQYLGEVTREETYTLPSSHATAHRELLRTGNFEISGQHFHWVSDFEIARTQMPPDAMLVERLAWGRFYGFPKAFLLDGKPLTESPGEIGREFASARGDVSKRRNQRRHLEIAAIGAVNRTIEKSRLDLKKIERRYGAESADTMAAAARFKTIQENGEVQFAAIRDEIGRLNRENDRRQIVFETADGKSATLSLNDIERAYFPNQLSLGGKFKVYGARWWEFLSSEPREANSEGGVFPAIFGTICMTLLMSVAVVPFGVLASLYLREYAKKGFMVSLVRIAVNNLAGVPSIVFGVFGLGFFCYIMGGSIDDLFFSAKLPNPTFGKGGIFWAALTLALLTLPVVIVATEEALAAVPNSLREGSYACGAGKWQTIRRIVLPRAMPGIMTGMILAMARGAGEVAPLMLVGAVKLAPNLPVDTVFPFVHAERSFMHLGFHIFDLGFQSQNSEAAKPMVFTTTLLLIGLIALLNLAAIRIRARLRSQFVTGQF